MRTELIATRKYNKETYKFYLNTPDFDGETGICGIEITPYLHVETPENGFGYTDTVLFNYGRAYTLNRYLQPWIKRRIERVADAIRNRYEYTIL